MQNENQKSLLREAYRLTELRLDVQLQFAVASDQRALVLAAISVALAGLMGGVSKETSESYWSVGEIMFFSLSALFAVVAALPQRMHTKGSKYGRLKSLIDIGSDYFSVIAGLSEENDEAIVANEKKAVVRMHLYRLSIILFGAGSILAMISINSSGNP